MDPLIRKGSGSSPLMIHAMFLHVECVESRPCGGDHQYLRQKDFDGNSALHLACRESLSQGWMFGFSRDESDDSPKRAQIVDLLLWNGASPSIKNKEGKTALDLMREHYPTDYTTTTPLGSTRSTS